MKKAPPKRGQVDDREAKPTSVGHDQYAPTIVGSQVRLSPLEPEAVRCVADRMRPADRREIYATRWTDEPTDLVDSCMFSGQYGWVAGLERPIAALGAIPMWPGAWSVWMFATDEFRQIRIGLTKFVARTMIPGLRASGAIRAECRSIADHEEAHRWLEVLGAHREAVLEHYGKRGESFFLYVWTR